MPRHDAWSKGKGGQGLDPHRVWGVPSSARRPPVGGCGSPPRWRRLPAKKERGCGGEEGHGVHAGRGGGAVGRLAGARARGWGCGALSRERHRSADQGRGAAGAGQSRPGSPGRPRRWGPRLAEGPAPRSAGTNPAEHHPRGRILVEAGGSATPSPRGRTGPGQAPPDGKPGRRAGLGSGAPGPGTLVAVGRRGGDRAGLWAVAGEGGRGRAGRARGRPPRGPQELGKGS